MEKLNHRTIEPSATPGGQRGGIWHPPFSFQLPIELWLGRFGVTGFGQQPCRTEVAWNRNSRERPGLGPSRWCGRQPGAWTGATNRRTSFTHSPGFCVAAWPDVMSLYACIVRLGETVIRWVKDGGGMSTNQSFPATPPPHATALPLPCCKSPPL